MKRFSIYIIALLLLAQFNFSFSQVSILDLTKQAGSFSLDFLIWNDSNLTKQVNAGDLKLSLNSATANFILKKTTSNAVSANKSILISLDISNAYDIINFDIAKNGLKGLFQKIKFQNPEIALSTYNTTAYLNQDLTKDYDKIVANFPYISLFGASNFENVFFHSFAGAENVFKNAKHEKHILIIADSYSEANINSIKQYLEKDSVQCYLIYFNQIAPPSLVNLTKSTSNFHLFNCKSEQISFDLALDKALKKIYNIDVFNLTFNSIQCGDSLSLALDYQNKQYKVNFNIPQNWQVNLKPIPNNKIEYVKVEANIPKDTIVELFSEYDSIKIQGIATNSQLLKYQIQDSFAFNGKSAKIKFTYQSTDTSYFKTKVDVISSACNILSFNFEVGTKTKLNNNSTINVIAPKLNEKLIAGNSTIIKWEGTSPQDTFKLEYTTNDGNSWNLISKTATSNSYNWKVPNEVAQYRIRISELAKTNIYEKVIYYNVPNNTYIDKISWGSVNVLSFSTDKGELYFINPFTQTIATKLSSDLKKVNDLKFGKSGTKIATSIDASTSNSNIVIFDSDEAQPPIKLLGNTERPKSLEWNNQSNLLFAGDFNGNLDIWSLSNPSSQTFSFPLYHNGAINAIAFNDNRSLLITAGSDSWIKFRSTTDWIVYNDTININDGTNDEVVSMKLLDDDKSLFLATKNSSIYYYDLYKNDTLFAPTLRFSNKANNFEYNQIGAYQNKFLYTSSSSISVISKSNEALYKYTGHTNQITTFDVNNNGYVASADNKGGLQIWRIDDYPFEKKILETSQSDNFQVVDIKLKIENINLGSYCLGKVLTKNINNYIVNQTIADITIDSIVISNDINSEFKITNLFPITIKANSGMDLLIDFSPTFESNKFLDITVYTNNFQFTKVLTAVGYDPRYEVSNSVINFGDLNYDQTKLLTDKLKITNSGTVNLKILNFEYQSKDTIFKLTQNNLPIAVPIDIAPNNSATFEVSFLPRNMERYNSLLRFNTQEFCTPIFVNLVGVGVAPSLNQNKFKLNTLVCASDKIDTILNIKNTGKGILEILSVKQISGNVNCNLNIVNGIAKPNENIALKCEYNDKSTKQDSNVFELVTNKLEDGTNKYYITILSKKDSIGIYTKDTTINFIVPNVNRSASQTISIKNTGTEQIDWSKETFSIAYFELKSITPLVCQPNETSQFEFYFTGSNKDTTLYATYFLETACSEKTFSIVAIVGSKETSIGFNPNFEAGLLKCNEPTTIKIPINNLGGNELLVSELQIEGDLLNEIQLISSVPIIVNASESYEIELQITPKQIESKNIQLIITSNAKNVPNSKAIISLSFKKTSNSFQKNNDTITLNNIIVNNIHSFSYNTKYTGNEALTIATPVIFGNNFTLDSVRPNIIMPDSVATFYFNLNALQEGKVSSSYNFSNNCNDSLNITINAMVSGSNYINVSIPKVASKTGDIVVFQANINNPRNLNLDFLKDATIEFQVNNSIAVPKFAWLSDTIVNGIRITKAIFDTQQEYKYLTTLGDSNLTNVDFKIETLDNPDLVSILTESGKITLTDVCYEGESRYVLSTGNFKFSSPYPNPCENEVHFEINAIEKGKYILDLYDEMGNFVKNLFNKELSPSSFTIINNVKDVPIGGYYCKLTTPSEVYFRKLIIIR